MADLPSASTTVEDEAVAGSGGVNHCVILAACVSNDDIVPRVFSSPAALLSFHGMCDGVDYAALHIQDTQEPVIFVGLPIVTPGVVGRTNSSGNTGTSVVSVAADGDGARIETDGVVTVINGGTIGTSQILLGLSLDGGRTTKRVRLGTANSYVIPNTGLTISFAAGTLVAGETVHTWHTTAPRWNQAGLAAARTALAAQLKQARSWIVIGDLLVEDDATDVVTEVNAYETSNDRFVYARCSVRDREPEAEMSQVRVSMTGNPNVTFAEVGATGDTITRSAGSFVTDGFAVNDLITVVDSVSNDFVDALITAVSATVLTLDTQDLVAEGPVGNVTITGTPRLTFAEVGATGDTLTRSRGSWLDDGFRVGDLVTIAGSGSNDFVATNGVTAVTATVLTFGTQDLAAEVIGSYGVAVTAGESKAAWISDVDAEFADIDSEPRIDLSAGRARKLSPILGYRFRRPCSWAASIREYQHDVHIPCWRKSDGPLSGWDLEDAEGNLVEFDERVDGGALAGRFTCFRTWANGPAGTFVALSLTRADEGSLLSRTHNEAVANVACTTVQAATENAIGQSLVLQPNGTATQDALNTISGRVNSSLEIALLQDKGEGARASKAVWVPSTDDVLNVPGAELTGTLELSLRGTIEKISTRVRIQTAG